MSSREQAVVHELRNSLTRIESMLASIEEAMLWTDDTGSIRWCNEAFVRLVGRPRIRLLGEPVASVLPLHLMGQPVPERRHPVRRILDGESSVHGDYEFRKEEVPLHIAATAVTGSDALRSAALTIRNRSRDLELEEHRIQRKALEAADDAIVIMESDGSVLWTNPAFTSLTGYPREEAIGRDLRLLNSGTHPADFFEGLWQTVLSGESWQGELVNRRKDGTLYHERQSITPVRNSAGDVTHFIAIKSDVSQIVEARRTLADREARLRALVEGVVDAIITADFRGTIESINPAAERIFGYDQGELLGQNVRVLVPPEIRHLHDGFMRRYLNTGEAKIIGIGREIEAVRKDGSRFPIELSINEIKVDATIRFTAIIRDITLRKRQEEELQRLNEKLEERVRLRTRDLSREVAERRQAQRISQERGELLRSLLEGIGAAFLVVDPETGGIAEMNGVAAELLGTSREDALGQDCAAVTSRLPETEFLCPPSSAAETYREGLLTMEDGRKRPVSRYVFPTSVNHREHVAVVFFDIAEQKQLERKLNMDEKLKSMGQLAAGIAHEINSPIQYIGDSLHFLEEANQDLERIFRTVFDITEKARSENLFPEELRQLDRVLDEADFDFLREEMGPAAEKAMEGVSRVTDIVRAMRNFSHPGGEGRQGVDINEMLETTITVSRNEWKYVAEVKTDFQELPTVMAYPGDLNQSFLNLVVNAAHAVEAAQGEGGDMGTITISSRDRGDHVEVCIADTGTGIAPEYRDMIFDPFFTTKKMGRGTGQGLTIVHSRIVEKHGGTIDVETEQGRGTTFIIRLPVGEPSE